MPVRNVSAGIVCAVVLGRMFCAACVVSCSVPDPLTVTVPEVPAETYPADTVGVIDCDALTDAVTSPELLTAMDGFAVIVVAGVAAEPEATDLEADSE